MSRRRYTPAEWAARRRAIGLSIDELAEVLKINPRTARGFEQPIPKYTPSPGLCTAMDDLLAEHTRQTELLAQTHAPILLPRICGTSGAGGPVGWHLAIAARLVLTNPTIHLDWEAIQPEPEPKPTTFRDIFRTDI